MKYFKEIGIIFSYLVLLLACYLYNWDVIHIFLSYLVEIAFLLFYYVFFRIRDENKFPEKYDHKQNVINVIIGTMPFFFLHGMLISLYIHFFKLGNSLFTYFTWQTVFALLLNIGFFYTVKAIQFKDIQLAVSVFRYNFLASIVVLTITNILGIIMLMGLKITVPFQVLSIMVFLRILFELIMIRKGYATMNSRTPS